MGVGGELKKAAKKMAVAACASFSRHTPSPPPMMSTTTIMSPNKPKPGGGGEEEAGTTPNHSKNLCAICLEALAGNSPGAGQAIFTAQCSHAFHFACIASNVRHGNVTCPICRAHWTQLPRNLNLAPCSLSCNQNDPVLRILDDSIATFRVHRRSFLRSARYNDDDPIEPDHTQDRLHFSLQGIPPCSFHHCTSHSGPPTHRFMSTSAYLSVTLSHPPPTDMVLVASPDGPHLRLLKQAMALVVFSLRTIDRLAIVTYSSSAARVFPLRRMTSYGKRAALQVIDRLFYIDQADDPLEGIKKGIKVLEDRAYRNLQSCILHMSDCPTRSSSFHGMNLQLGFPIHRFHVGFGFGSSSGLVMHEFEVFLASLLAGVVRDIQLRMGEEGLMVRIGELRGGEERKVLVELGECGHVCLEYSYIEGGVDGCLRRGETVVSLAEKLGDLEDRGGGGRSSNSSVESWDYHDPFMARRWAKHLHGYRL